MSAQPPVQAPRAVAVPSDRLWFDPMVLNVATYPQISTVAVAAFTPTPVVVPNTRRWGIGFALPPTFTGWSFSPWPDADAFNLFALSNAASFGIMTLQTFGPLVSSGWWAYFTNPGSVRVVELIRQP